MSCNHSFQVKNHFRDNWVEYDKKIEKVIPFYTQGFNTIIEIVKNIDVNVKSVLDIGIGTGNLSLALLNEFENITLIGIDIVDEYIKTAKAKLSKFEKQITLHCLDANNYSFNQKFDLIISSFVFHHLENKNKKNIYRKIFNSLNTGGVVINFDFVGSESSLFYGIFDILRMNFMKENGISDEMIQKDYIEHREFEIPLPYSVQKEYLTEIGFAEVECFWKYLNLAIFGGIKSK